MMSGTATVSQSTSACSTRSVSGQVYMSPSGNDSTCVRERGEALRDTPRRLRDREVGRHRGCRLWQLFHDGADDSLRLVEDELNPGESMS